MAMGGGECADGCGRPIAVVRTRANRWREIPYCVGHAVWRGRASRRPKTLAQYADLFGVRESYIRRQLRNCRESRPGGFPWFGG